MSPFVVCPDAIKIFLSGKGQNYPKLVDDKSVVQLVFLTDITAYLNELNLHLQGAGQTVMDLFETCKAFRAKLAIFLSGH